MDEIKIDKIEWSAPEYFYRERENDWFWAVGLISLIAFGVAIWLHNYVFAIFLLLAGATLILFTIRHPRQNIYLIETKGLTMGKDLYEWKMLKSFNIKKQGDTTGSKLLIETRKYFLPVYTIPLNEDRVEEVKKSLLLVLPRSDIDESKSMIFMEKLGF